MTPTVSRTISVRTRRARIVVTLIAAVFAGACVSTPEVDPTQVRLDDLDTRVGRIDRIVSSESLSQLAQRLDTQEAELRNLRGRVEELQNENATLRKEQRDLYADLDARLSAAPAASVSAAPAVAVAAPVAEDEPTQYNRAFDALKARNYAAAGDGFRKLAASHPNGKLADNTQYWLGETYYVTQSYEQALATFQRVLDGWPDSRKAPDALLKLGFTQIELKRAAAARASLNEVLKKYPDSDAARLAADRLAKLPAADR